jgi:hypothetical protein
MTKNQISDAKRLAQEWIISHNSNLAPLYSTFK